MAISEAMADIESGSVQPVPEHLKNKHVKAIGSETVTEYRYPHNFANHYVKQEYMGIPKNYYRPTQEGYEATISKRLNALRA
jgi:putative ATPase